MAAMDVEASPPFSSKLNRTKKPSISAVYSVNPPWSWCEITPDIANYCNGLAIIVNRIVTLIVHRDASVSTHLTRPLCIRAIAYATYARSCHNQHTWCAFGLYPNTIHTTHL